MDEFRRSLDEFARDKAPPPADVARLQQSVRKAVLSPRPRRADQLFAYGGWVLAAVSLLLFVFRPSPSTLILSDPSRAALPPRLAAGDSPAPEVIELPSYDITACAPVVRSVTPTRLTAQQPVTFSFQGACLPATAQLLAPGCSAVHPVSSSDSSLAFSCAPAVVGKHPALLRDRVDGRQIFSFVFEVSEAPPSASSAPSAAPPPPPPPVASSPPAIPIEHLWQIGRGHLYRIEGVTDVTRDTAGASASRAEQQCFAGKHGQLVGMLAAAREQAKILERSVRSGDRLSAELALERLASSRRSADIIYRQAQECVAIGL